MCLDNKIGSVLPVLCELATEYDVISAGPKNLTERNHVELVGGSD
jgi:hypothetical protein